MPKECRERQQIRYEDNVVHGLRGFKTLPEICQSVHMTTSGSADIYEEYKADIYILQDAVRFWVHEIGYTKEYDDAVLNLIKITLTEVEKLNDTARIFN